MSLEALSTNELFNFIVHNTSYADPYNNSDLPSPIFLPESGLKPPEIGGASNSSSSMMQPCLLVGSKTVDRKKLVVQGRKKRRRRPKVCKNKEEAEAQRMTHIAVERNRRKQMNEHLVALRSLMPESYAQRGDQASIVGGAIQYVKELEHLIHSREAQKLLLLQEGRAPPNTTTATVADAATEFLTDPFVQFFGYPQWRCCQTSDKYTSKSKADGMDIEVTLIETHANLRILSRKSPRQLSKMVTGFQTLSLSILHLHVTTLNPLVLYSISAKVEEGCRLTSADDIAGAVHQMLITIMEEEATLC